MIKILLYFVNIFIFYLINIDSIHANQNLLQNRLQKSTEMNENGIQTEPLQTNIPTELIETVNVQEPFLTVESPEPKIIFGNPLPSAGDAHLINDVLWLSAGDSILKGYRISLDKNELSPIVEFDVGKAILAHLNLQDMGTIYNKNLSAAWQSYLLVTTQNIDSISRQFDNTVLTGGIHIIDVSNPAQPVIVSQIPLDTAGGLHVIDGILYARVTPYTDFTPSDNFFAAFDIRTPNAPTELWRVPIPNNSWIYACDVNSSNTDIVYAVGKELLIYDQSMQPPQLLSRWKINQKESDILFLEEYNGTLIMASKETYSFFQSPSQNIPLVFQHSIRMTDPVTPHKIYSIPISSTSPTGGILFRNDVIDDYVVTWFGGPDSRIYFSKIIDESEIQPSTVMHFNQLIPAVKDSVYYYAGMPAHSVYPISSLLPITLIHNWFQHE